MCIDYKIVYLYPFNYTIFGWIQQKNKYASVKKELKGELRIHKKKKNCDLKGIVRLGCAYFLHISFPLN